MSEHRSAGKEKACCSTVKRYAFCIPHERDNPHRDNCLKNPLSLQSNNVRQRRLPAFYASVLENDHTRLMTSTQKAQLNWYCVHTKPKKEILVERFLNDELALETYFPRLRRKRTIRRVKREVLEPLFPRYLFCRLSLADSYRAVIYGRDVLGLVSAGDKPTLVDEQIIQQLRDWAGTGDDVITLEPKAMKKGDPVKITEGPMQGLEATFLQEASKDERVAILLNLMNTEVQLKIDRTFIEAVES